MADKNKKTTSADYKVSIPIKTCVSAYALTITLILIGFVIPALAYEEIEVANGGALTGKVLYQGSVAKKKVIPTKDKEICGGIRDKVLIHVGPDKGVHNAVVYLKKVAKGKPWEEQTETPQISNKDCVFEPHVQIMRSGDIDILNEDPILHNTHGYYGRRTAFNLALPNKGDVITKQLKRPGTVRVDCDAHGWMLGWVYVADSPYYTLTTEDGTFSITDIPPGDYTLVATQEYTGDTEMSVTIKAGETAEVYIELKK